MTADEKVNILLRALLKLQRSLNAEHNDNELCLIADALEECEENERRSPLRHEGLDVSRLEYLSHEKAFADAWKTENPPNIEGLLERLMRNLDDDRTREYGVNFCHGVTQRDATIVATVIQWLGSHVGRQFVTAALSAAGTETMPTEIYTRLQTTRAEYRSEFDQKEYEARKRRTAAWEAVQEGINKTKGFFGDPEAHAALQKALAALSENPDTVSEESDKEAA